MRSGVVENSQLKPSFKLPAEHGAVVTFALASVLGLLVSREPVAYSLGLIFLWLMFLSMHRMRQSLTLSLVLAVLAASTKTGVPLVIPHLFLLAGNLLLRHSAAYLHVTGRETLGMLGAGILPFILAVICGSSVSVVLVVGSCFIASTLFGTAIVRLTRPDTRVSAKFPVALSMIFAFNALLFAPLLTLLCILPFIAELILLKRMKKPSFKLLGIASSVSLLSVSTVLIVWMML